MVASDKTLCMNEIIGYDAYNFYEPHVKLQWIKKPLIEKHYVQCVL